MRQRAPQRLYSPFKGSVHTRIMRGYELQNSVEVGKRFLRIDNLHTGRRFAKTPFTRKSPFSRLLQTSIDAFKLISGRVIYTAAQFRIDFERDLRELALRLFWPIRDSLQCLLEGLCSHNNTICFTCPMIKLWLVV
jgi:hypothetical protein